MPNMNQATWKGHGRPEQFIYYGYGTEPDQTGVEVTAKQSGSVVRLARADDGQRWDSFGSAMKFWAC